MSVMLQRFQRRSDDHSQRAVPRPDRLQRDGKFFCQNDKQFRWQGVTYGPFAAGSNGEPFPAAKVVQRDLSQMAQLGINAIRTYHMPGPWLLELVSEQSGVGVLADIPWSKHLCFLDSAGSQKEARAAVSRAAQLGARFPAIQAYSIGNEIPPDVVRWHGARRVERFLRELMDVAKQADPERLVTYANYPPTEYLDLSFLDFVTFNVYLHDRQQFRRYLLRLQNLVGDKPLVLGEIGMDTLRHGEIEQASFLAGHLREAQMLGLAGTFVFSWTDEWHTGGAAVDDWAFGITYADRLPKASCHALREIFDSSPTQLLQTTPKVSIVVCSYNGGATLEQCLNSMLDLDYPNYEVILVDDGSTDNTRDIASRFPSIRTVHQTNQGLSVARNVGLQAAAGDIVAYTDSDCFVSTSWLTHLVAQLEGSDAAAVGGPNLAPDDGRIAACVGAAPGQPMHVLESDQVAEHIPGCNMAFRRDALLAINGFDPQFVKAGDDVDVCWRLQDAGFWITFSSGAFVWHHRRQTARMYFRQQAGYGDAEALLRFKHPERFNGRGHGKWRGILYGSSVQGLVLDDAIIYRGTFATGLFQCIYQPGPAHWAMIPGTLEWQLLAAAMCVMGIGSWQLGAVGVLMLFLSFVVATAQARQARIARQYDDLAARFLIATLCWAQPIVRSWARYRTRYFGHHPATAALGALRGRWSPFRRYCAAAYWGGATPERVDLLRHVFGKLDRCRCGKTIDTGWTDADLEVFTDLWTFVRLKTAQEEHGGGKRVIRVASVLRLSKIAKAMLATGFVAAVLASGISWPFAGGLAGVLVGWTSFVWCRGSRLSAKVLELCEESAETMSLVKCTPHMVSAAHAKTAATPAEAEIR